MRRSMLGLAAFAAVSCGGAPAAPAPSAALSTSEPQPAATVQVEGATINFAAGVSAADRDLIARAAILSRTFFESRFGRVIGTPVTVNVNADDGPMQAQGHVVTLSTGEQSWIRTASAGRTKTVVHEFFHVLQTEGGWTFQPIEWLYEGTAEFVGYAAAIDAGLTGYATVRACEIDIYFNGGGSATPPLHEISFSRSSTVGSRYAVAWLAVDHLIGGLDGVSRLKGMWENGGSVDERFLAAFGMTAVAFSDSFQKHRLTFQPVGGQPCASL